MNKKINIYARPMLFFKMAVFLTLIILVIISAASCIRLVGFSGSGNVITEERNISGFDSVSVSSGINLIIEQTGSESLKIEAEDNIVPKIITKVTNGKLNIMYKPWTLDFIGINTSMPINVYLNVSDLNTISLSSGSTLNCKELNTEKLKVNLNSGASGEIKVKVKELDTALTSGSTLKVQGDAGKQEVKLSSGVTYDAENLVSKIAEVKVSSGAAATLNVSDSLDVNISSGGSVKYIGSPRIISNISSGGSLENLNK